WQHGAERFSTADDMQVHMLHLLPAHSSGIDDQAKPVLSTLFARQFRSEHHGPAEQVEMILLHFHHRRDVSLGDDEKMNGRQRMNIMEGEDLRVLVHLP